jgi:chemotaxis signal transduction protein
VEFPLLTLLCRAGTRRFFAPAASVTRVIGATAFTPVAGLPGAAVGVVNVAGENLALVDSRLALGETQSVLHPAQRFLQFDAPKPWLLWVDAVESVQELSAEQCDALTVGDAATVRYAVRLKNETLPLIDPIPLEPGVIVQPLVR